MPQCNKYYIDINYENDSYDEQLSISVDTSIAIWQLIDTFPGSERECLVMKFIEDMTVDEIAQNMNVTRKAVERTSTSAYRRFKKLGYSLYGRK